MTFVVLMRRSFLFEKEQKDMFISSGKPSIVYRLPL